MSLTAGEELPEQGHNESMIPAKVISEKGAEHITARHLRRVSLADTRFPV